MPFKIFAPALLGAVLFASAAAAEPRVAVGGGYGTAGAHAAVEYLATRHLVLRGAVNQVYFDDDVKLRNIDYSTEAQATLFTGSVQYHPWANALFVEAGVVLGEREVEFDALPRGPKKIGGQVFTPAQIGRLEGEADFGDAAPLLGFGLDSTFRGERITLRLAAGVVFGDRPEVELRSVGGVLSGNPLFAAGLKAEAEELETDLDPMRFHPVIEGGVTFRF